MDVVATPFRIVIPAGTSTFNVQVPKQYLMQDRKFYFNELHLTPDFFNKDADLLGLDTDAELNKMIDYPVQVKVEYKDLSTYYGPNYKNSTSIDQTVDAIEKINDHFENNKPDFAITTPFFIDWIDKHKHETHSPDRYVPKDGANYYGERFNPALHGDRLPSSVQAMDDVNNYLPPIGTMKSTLLYEERIVLRIWMAPFTRAILSSLQPFVDDWGFTEEQFGSSYRNQYHLVNRSQNWRPVLIGEKAPKETFSKADFRILVAPINNVIINRLHITSLSKRDWKNNEKVALYLKNIFRLASNNLNTIFSFGFNEQEDKFYFHFPSSDNVSVTIMCMPEFALRLGYGQEQYIVKGMQPQPQKENDTTILDAHHKAMALVYDTGPIICTLDNISSNTTSGADGQFMAALYPQMPGNLSMPDSKGIYAVHLNILTQSTAAFVPITFRLIRIYDNEKIANFFWSQDAYVYGILSGFCLSSQNYINPFIGYRTPFMF
jgi:hypothetical protein